ncbi:short chain dehydrogenase [Rhodococcus rhodnii LMG 5362]|uniref:Short chain dehydrogenase n=1 Tax=Rhodococcus rhodnii LMG 5362 TaxID=1273125 RepID=R7WL32_9NOCA|nr:short chain dehydrogenase [Rhodococcus rhodnii LMG 5362]
MNLGDPNYENRRYSAWLAYGQSKLANLLFAYELQRRLAASGSQVRSLAAHPGYASTNLQSHTESVMDKVMAVANSTVAQSAEMGALPELYAATSPNAFAGAYIGPGGPFGVRGYPQVVSSNRKSHDEDVAARLWELSERLTGVRYLS